ncbi:hypothetical protein AAG570_012621 [Ranatra chinensis]|uniref:LicD/FKTN/FKRP nucleotidyltransferase domain-containing protein n=1 Tax=Ranatra chinensis TaxID=642074 RepID=A0ABD0YED1_9HEMI
MNEFSESFFVECNFTRAEIFKNRYPSENNTSNLRFKHRAWKLLSLVKTILDGISVKFWLSSGTCLGYFRECDFIPYSSDVDIGIFADDYNDNIISEMIAHGFIWKHWFGLRNDSLELSFVDKNGLKLDIFFFYEEGNTFWNGGTQARTGMKFKYIFPKFKLCWTLFQYLKVRIPCNTEQYIIANYGPNWFTQVRHWDWKSSPFNVVQNGKWSKEELMYANRISP